LVLSNKAMTVKKLKRKLSSLQNRSNFSFLQMAFFVVAFSVTGYFVWRGLAAAPVMLSLEAEQMTQNTGGTIVTDQSASGLKAVELDKGASLSADINLPADSDSFSVIAKSGSCSTSPEFSVALDSKPIAGPTAVTTTSWKEYKTVKTISAGKHTFSFTSSGQQLCKLSLDVVNFNGTTPAPTISFSASPQTVSSGQSSTLSWSATNATSCSLSGGLSSTQPVSGSVSTGPLDTDTSYSLTCTGTGGSSSQSAKVTITSNVITFGETGVLTNTDDQTSNLLFAQQEKLAKAGSIKSISVYIASPSGKLRLGVYDSTGPNGGPGAKKAETAEITPTSSWNSANVTSPANLAAGNYWLAFLTNDNKLGLKMERNGSAAWYQYGYNTMPDSFSQTPTTGNYHWSIYATLNSQ
jgi:hypothetical protein